MFFNVFFNLSYCTWGEWDGSVLPCSFCMLTLCDLTCSYFMLICCVLMCSYCMLPLCVLTCSNVWRNDIYSRTCYFYLTAGLCSHMQWPWVFSHPVAVGVLTSRGCGCSHIQWLYVFSLAVVMCVLTCRFCVLSWDNICLVLMCKSPRAEQVTGKMLHFQGGWKRLL